MNLKQRLQIEAETLAVIDRKRAELRKPDLGRCIEAAIIAAHLDELAAAIEAPPWWRLW